MTKPIAVKLWPDGCNMLGVGRTTGFRLAAEGQLDTFQIGRSRLVTVDSIERLVAKSVNGEPQPAA
jgi:hypothetical protein